MPNNETAGPQTCPQCGFVNPEGFNFCGKCGAVLTASENPAPANADSEHERRHKPGRASAKAERRQITVMFCDLVGSTDLSTRLDPEDLRELVRDYQEACEKAILAFDGHVAQYLGDGLLVYFGFPRAHENDAQRAVRAGLGILEEIARLNENLATRNVPLAVRIGIHTGLVVVGEMGGRTRLEHLALGQTPNLAARLQGLAQPNAIVLSGTTHKLIQNDFEFATLGAQTRKGVAQSVEVYQVLCARVPHAGFEKLAVPDLTPLFGRERELAQLTECWQRAAAASGQAILLGGEAGVGKSRLQQAFQASLAGERHLALVCRCSPYETNRALHPIFDMLEQFFAIKRDTAHDQKTRALQSALATHGLRPDEIRLLLQGLLPDSPQAFDNLSYGSTQVQKQKIYRALLRLLQSLASRQPLILTVEDLHWADSATLELCHLIIDEIKKFPILAVFTFRPIYTPPWQEREHLLKIMLLPLPAHETEAMIHALAGGKTLPREMLRQLALKTDGVPLFIEELTKMVLETGLLIEHENHFTLAGPLPALAIPTTLHDSLMARLDRLATVKDVVQLGAVIGREFSYELMHLVAQIDHATLQNELARLVEAGLLYEEGALPGKRFVFKHALIRDTAYEALLKSTRQLYHMRIAQVLVDHFPRVIEAKPELIAYHYTEAKVFEQAAPFWHQAAQRASRRSAPDEAIAYLNKGLALLQTLPATPATARLELDFLIALGSALVVTKGYAAAQVELTYARALACATQLGEHPHLYPALLGLSTYFLIRGDFAQAHKLAEQALKLAEQEQDPAVLVEAHYVLGTAIFHLGYLEEARAHLQQGIALYETRQHRSMIARFGHDSGVLCLCYLARILWFQGYPDQAQRRSAEAVVLARELAHPFSLASALTFAALVSQLRLEIDATRELAEEAISLCTEHGFLFCLAMATVLNGWALTELNEQEVGIAQIERGLETWRAAGAELFRPHLLALLVESYGKAGRTEEGLHVLAEALAAAQKSGKRFYTAELYRLQALLLMRQGRSIAEVEQCFQQALAIARERRAKSLELRAAVGWVSQQSESEEARQILQQTYQWFSEGFDTLDLQLAETLLAKF